MRVRVRVFVCVVGNDGFSWKGIRRVLRLGLEGLKVSITSRLIGRLNFDL